MTYEFRLKDHKTRKRKANDPPYYVIFVDADTVDAAWGLFNAMGHDEHWNDISLRDCFKPGLRVSYQDRIRKPRSYRKW